MFQFTKPQHLNGAQLISELETAGVNVPYENGEPVWPLIDGEGGFWLAVPESQVDLAAEVVALHVGADS